jgi:hypothetical protein
MPRHSTRPKPHRRPNQVFKNIRPKLSEETSMLSNGLGSITEPLLRGLGIPGTGHKMGFLLSSGAYSNNVEIPGEYGPARTKPEPFGNDSNETSNSNHDLSAEYTSKPFPSTQTKGVGREAAASTAPDSFSIEGSYYKIYAVKAQNEPLCAVLNNQSDYSCMLATVAESLSNVTIRDTTPAQRQRWYTTPAGPLVSPERYIEISLSALDPLIPPMELTLLLWEGNGPIDGVHVYLGHAVFAQVERLGFQMKVQEFQGQNTGFHPTNQVMADKGHAGMRGEYTVRLISRLKLIEIKAPQDQVTATYDKSSGPSNLIQVNPPSFTLGPRLTSDFQRTIASLPSSEASYSTTTVTSLDSIISAADIPAKIKKNPSHDVFLGYEGVELDSDEDEVDSTTINPALLITWEDRLHEEQCGYRYTAQLQ